VAPLRGSPRRDHACGRTLPALGRAGRERERERKNDKPAERTHEYPGF
jgi:hypothetical protein